MAKLFPTPIEPFCSDGEAQSSDGEAQSSDSEAQSSDDEGKSSVSGGLSSDDSCLRWRGVPLGVGVCAFLSYHYPLFMSLWQNALFLGELKVLKYRLNCF